MPALLGEILIKRHLIDEAKLHQALALQKKSGSRLGDILVGEGMIGYLQLYQAVAEHYALPFVDLLENPPSKELLSESDANLYLRLRAMPWRTENGQVTVATSEPSEEVTTWVRWRFGRETQLAITSPFDIRHAVEQAFGYALETESRLSLWQADPLASARTTLLAPQKRIVQLLAMTAIFAIALVPVYSALAFIIVCHIAFAATMIFKTIVFDRGTRSVNVYPRDWKKLLASLDEKDLPVYTVLIPMYREAAVLPRLLSQIEKLDYPAAKLDIKLVLENDDYETFDATRRLKPRYQFDIIRVPPSTLRTKPKACNYAIRFARGEFITIFDADDRPDPLQLKKAIWSFRNLPQEVVCLQARLNYYNACDNWLTRLFSLEYTILFQFMLYGLERLGIPIPLGGTSNHMALSRLRGLGEWDPYNVTEDADLGTRLATRGYRTAMLDSYTLEEAPVTVGAWIRQRSRWIKGYMQTWLVHMRQPVTLWQTLGSQSFTGFQFFIGLASFTFLVAPIVWILSLLWIGQLAGLHQVPFPNWLGWLTFVNLLFNFLSHWYFALTAALHYRRLAATMVILALFYPFYLILHSIASYKALWQLLVNPHFWEKTVHGLAQDGELHSEEDLLKSA